MSVIRSELEHYLRQLLKTEGFQDYCPNGLQVEGSPLIRKVVTGVSACLSLIEKAIEHRADALIVHHGFFWKNESPVITHTKKMRIARLLAANLNLFAYHLPLDAHPELGNNAQLGQLLGLIPIGHFGQQNLGWLGDLAVPLPFSAFSDHVQACLDRPPLALGNPEKQIRRVAWCSGGAQHYFHLAATMDIDCFITGEASEFVTHLVHESGVCFIAAGHHATESYGVSALGAHLAAVYHVAHVHIDIQNPI